MADDRTKPSALSVFSKGILVENPTLRQMLGLCPALAVTTAVTNGIGMGVATTFVLVCSGIVVSLLANNNPIGVLFSGAFFGAIHNGGINMERITSVPSAVTDIVTGIIFLMIGAKFVLPKIRKKMAVKRAEGKGGN